jgi:hypothetical protein
MLSRPCLGPPPLTLGVHPGGRNIAYDLALVKLGPHTKFGEDWSNGVDFYTGHTHTHTDSPLYLRCRFSNQFARRTVQMNNLHF